jgi:hypothetical protein
MEIPENAISLKAHWFLQNQYFLTFRLQEYINNLVLVIAPFSVEQEDLKEVRERNKIEVGKSCEKRDGVVICDSVRIPPIVACPRYQGIDHA